MKFDLHKPCAKCPFRTDCLEGWLGEDRALEIIDAIMHGDQTFPCHETVDYGVDEEDEPRRSKDEKHCAGAAIFLERQGESGRPNQMMRIAERLGLYDRKKLDMEAPVFDSSEEFVEHHSEKKDDDI